MGRIILLLATTLLSAVLLTSGVGMAIAEPGKNQITVPATCDDHSYTFVINAMSKTGHIISGGTGNIVVKKGTVTYFDPETKQQIGDPQDIGGNKKGFKGDLIHCTGQTTTDLVGMGPVTAVYDFQAFITPRGNQ
jgi:hypothetical protein